MRKRAIFWRWVAISRSRRVRNDSSRLRASEALVDWLWAAASAAAAWATSAGRVRKAVARRVRTNSTACSFTRFSICASIRDCKSTAWGGYEENGAAELCDNNSQTGGGLDFSSEIFLAQARMGEVDC